MTTRYLKTNLGTGAMVASSEIIPIADGGTNASSVGGARISLGIQPTFNGIEDATKITPSYSASTQTLSLTYSSGAAIWVLGTRYTLSGSGSLQHANSTGKHYFYYNESGTLTTGTSAWDIMQSAPILAVYYNATTGLAIPLDERHPAASGMDDSSHKYNHLTRGTQLVSGFTISGYTLNTAGSTALSYAVSSGVISDEDLFHDCSALADGGPYRILYRSGASGIWTWDDTSTTGILDNGTNIYYNRNNAGTWQLTPIASNNTWVNYYTMILPELSGTKRTVVVMGQATFASLSNAQAEDPSIALSGLANLTDEAVVVARITYRRLASTPSNAQIQSVQAIRQNLIATISGVTPGDHQSLTGRDSLDAHPATAISTTGFSQNLNGITTVQGALDYLDTMAAAAPVTTIFNVGAGGQSEFSVSGITASNGIDVFVNGVLLPTENSDWTRDSINGKITISETIPQYAVVTIKVYTG